MAHTRPSQHDLCSDELSPNHAFLTDPGYKAKAGQQVGGTTLTVGAIPDPEIATLSGKTLKSRKTKFYSSLAKQEDPIILAELKIIQKKGRPSEEIKAQQIEIVERWRREHPDLYEKSIWTDERVKEQRTVTDSTRLTSGNKKFISDNVKKLQEDLPLAMGCIVTNIPLLTMMDGFIQCYGDPIVQQTVLGGSPSSPAQAINVSKLDEAFLRIQFEPKAPVAGLTDQEAEHKRTIFRQVALMSKELLRTARSEDTQDTQVTDLVPMRTDEVAEKVLDQAIELMEVWLCLKKDKWTLEALHDRIVESLNNSQDPLVYDHEEVYLCLAGWGVEGCWFLIESRTKYFFHHWWYCMNNIPHIVPGSSLVEPHTVLALATQGCLVFYC